MTYHCDITKRGKWYVPRFPDMTNVLICAETPEGALDMAKEALNAVLKTDIEKGYPIPKPLYTGGYSIEVLPDIVFDVMARMGYTTEKATEERLAQVYLVG